MSRRPLLLGLACAVSAHAALATVALPKTITARDLEGCAGGPEWLALRREEARRLPLHAAPTNASLRDALVKADGDDLGTEALANAAAAAADAAAAAADAAMSDALDSSPWQREAEARQAATVERVRRIVAETGVPTAAEIGDDGMFAFIGLLQSASTDADFQISTAEAALAKPMASIDRGLRRLLAELVDETLGRQGRPQRYGTLLDRNAQGQLSFAEPVENAGALDVRRKAAGLPAATLELCARQNGGAFWPPYL